MITTITIFDFDGTLCESPLPTPENKTHWESVNGIPWRYKGGGWWSKPESLCSDTFDIQLIPHVRDAAIQAIADVNTYTSLVTGRMPLFGKIVKGILRDGGVPYMDSYHFNNTHRTLEFKLNVFDMLRAEFPEATHFTMWEDRLEHIPHFEEWGQKHYGSNFTLHVVG
jgi:hypothetical protein